MSKSHSDPSAFVPAVTAIDCQRCGAKGYVVRRSPLSDDPAGEIRIYVCGECGERTEIVVKG
jgi:DNA-directed RNA polymerase subunit RPC12/RpoP